MIDTIICDCDGVLNDGKQAHYIRQGKLMLVAPGNGELTQSGYVDSYQESMLEKPFKTFHSRDKSAIRRMTQSGIRVIIVSADDSPITKAWAESCGAEFMYRRVKVFGDEDGINWETTAGIGDDLMDLPFLEKCAEAFCPFDAHEEVKKIVGFLNGGHPGSFSALVSKPGGSGVFAEVAHILKNSLSLQEKPA